MKNIAAWIGVICLTVSLITGTRIFAQEEQAEVSPTDNILLKGKVPLWVFSDKNENGVVDKGDELLWPARTIGKRQLPSGKKVSTVYVLTKCIKGSVKENEPDTIIYYADPYPHSDEPAVIGVLTYDKSIGGYFIEVKNIYEAGVDQNTLRPPKDEEKRLRVAWSPQLRKDADKYVRSQVVLIGRIINARSGIVLGVERVL